MIRDGTIVEHLITVQPDNKPFVWRWNLANVSDCFEADPRHPLRRRRRQNGLSHCHRHGWDPILVLPVSGTKMLLALHTRMLLSFQPAS